LKWLWGWPLVISFVGWENRHGLVKWEIEPKTFLRSKDSLIIKLYTFTCIKFKMTLLFNIWMWEFECANVSFLKKKSKISCHTWECSLVVRIIIPPPTPCLKGLEIKPFWNENELKTSLDWDPTVTFFWISGNWLVLYNWGDS
jgi:hypothetical protein